jgi:hypothetical protein
MAAYAAGSSSHASRTRRRVNRDDFIHRAGQGPQEQQIFLVTRQEHPFAIAATDN